VYFFLPWLFTLAAAGLLLFVLRLLKTNNIVPRNEEKVQKASGAEPGSDGCEADEKLNQSDSPICFEEKREGDEKATREGDSFATSVSLF
jgi:hypothetical protein